MVLERPPKAARWMGWSCWSPITDRLRDAIRNAQEFLHQEIDLLIEYEGTGPGPRPSGK
jgi:hypothetical protein